MDYGKWLLPPLLPTHRPDIANIFPHPYVLWCSHASLSEDPWLFVWRSLAHLFYNSLHLQIFDSATRSLRTTLFTLLPCQPQLNIVLPFFSQGNTVLLSICNQYKPFSDAFSHIICQCQRRLKLREVCYSQSFAWKPGKETESISQILLCQKRSISSKLWYFW